jgi:ligand-binding sensor domain-containing protein
LSSIALDASGNLWLSSSCADQVVRVPAEELTGTAVEKESDVLIAGATAADGLAFDTQGNLWVGGGTTLLRYDASRLDEPTGDAADLTIQVKDGEGDLMAQYLAFDKAGNLWSVPLAGPLFQLAAADLEGEGTKEVDANVSIALDVNALAHQPAFDDDNGLWLSWTDGNVARLSATQLGTSVGAGSPVKPSVIVKSTRVGASLPVAFFPAPQGLPLYHSIPEE